MKPDIEECLSQLRDGDRFDREVAIKRLLTYIKELEKKIEYCEDKHQHESYKHF